MFGIFYITCFFSDDLIALVFFFLIVFFPDEHILYENIWEFKNDRKQSKTPPFSHL